MRTWCPSALTATRRTGDIFVLYFDGAAMLGRFYPLSGSRTTKMRIGIGLFSGVMQGNPRPGISFHSLLVRVLACPRMFSTHTQ